MNELNFGKVQSLFEHEDEEALLSLNAQLLKQLNAAKFLSTNDLLAKIQNHEGNLGRNIGAEMLIPRYVFQERKRCSAIR